MNGIVTDLGFGVHEGKLLELLPTSGPAGRRSLDNSTAQKVVKQPRTSIRRHVKNMYGFIHIGGIWGIFVLHVYFVKVLFTKNGKAHIKGVCESETCTQWVKFVRHVSTANRIERERVQNLLP